MADSSKSKRAANPDALDQEKTVLIAEYKRLLQSFLDRRPSGTRLKIADALQTHKSFVTQITNPAYSVPLPETHVETIMAICHFTQEERQEFLKAYADAHPRRSEALRRGRRKPRVSKRLTIDIPDFKDPGLQRQVEATITAMAEQVIRLAKRNRS
ncbi:MAG: hypothetical protein MI741_05835 [Rhodospirillales bacterium]|nr:hypothetical protein [Rhodospirillales bacterium]